MKINIGTPSDYGVSGVNRRIDKLLKIRPLKGGTVLDLGTGIGAYYPVLKRLADRLFAFDGEIGYLRKFKEKNPKASDKIFLAKSEKIPLTDSVFDAVFAIEVLEHVRDLELTVKEVNRILKKGGNFFITVPNKFFPLETHMVHFGNFYVKGRYVPFFSMNDFIHKRIGTARRFSEKDFYEKFTKLGFKVVGIDYMMPPFDYFNFGRKYLKSITNNLEKSRLKIFSMTILTVLEKTKNL